MSSIEDISDPTAPRDITVEAGGVATHVVVRGRGAPLLMINGVGAHVEMWQPLADELSKTRCLIMFDAPGCGRTPALRRPLRMRGVADLVTQLLDALGYSRVDVLGYSWGGAVAQQLAHDAPDRVGNLVLASTIPGLGGQVPSLKVLGLMTTPLRYVSPSYMRRVAPHIYGGDERHPEARTHGDGLAHWNDQPPTAVGYSHQLFAIAGWSSLPWLRNIQQRTLIICGEDDPLVPARNGRILARAIPQSELRLIAGAGHLWLLDHAPESSSMIENFLAVDAR